MGRVKINGIHIFTDSEGDGPPLVCIPGTGSDHLQYTGLVHALSRHIKVITMDCRGHGQSDKPFTYTLADHVNDILSLMHYYQIKKTYLLGTSGGSYIAQAVAIRVPEKIAKLILTVPKSNGQISSLQRLFKSHAKEIAGMGLHEKMSTLAKYFTFDPDIIKHHTDLLESKLTPAQFMAANNALAGFDFRTDLKNITAETLVVSGKYDGLNPPKEGKAVAAAIPCSTYVEMPYSGHFPAREEPESYLQVVKEFLLNGRKTALRG